MEREKILNRADIHHLDEISSLIISCEHENDDETTKNYGELCALLIENVRRLDLDECILNLSRFSVGLATEISEVVLKRGSRFGDARHWEWRPVTVKIDGANFRLSDVRSADKQAACMVDVLLNQLRIDELFKKGADTLLKYQQKNHLWTIEDEPDVDI